MVVGQALSALMQQHFDAYQQLFIDNPELEQLLPLACLYQDSGARAGDKHAQAAQAAKHFTDDMLASGYSSELVEQLANVLRQPQDSERREDSLEGLFAQLIQLSKQVVIPSDKETIAAGLPCAENEEFIDELAAFTKSARILSAIAGEYHPTGAHEDAKTYANTHGLIDLGALGRARRYAMKVSATPVQDMKLWLDNHVQREVALRAGISIDSDHELHQIPMPKDLPLVDKFLLDRSHMEPLLAQLSEQAKSHPPQHGTGSLTQELLKSEAVQNAIKNDHGIDVERVREVDVYKSRTKPPKQHTLLSTRYPQNKK